MEQRRVYAAIDLKSFYASVECVARGLDPLTANLVVADASRTDKTICLAVSPALKQALGVPGRCRLFEVKRRAAQVRAQTGRTVEFITAPPRMRVYMETSARIYGSVYLANLSAEDIHVYSIDEVFLDLTGYLKTRGQTAEEMVRELIDGILLETGITATAGIGTNLYLAKVAMDIVAKHKEADTRGVRIAFLDEAAYRRLLWAHTPITDFWRVGRGTAARLQRHGMRTMGDVARRSLTDEDVFFREFGVDAELLLDHAWGEESCTMADIKAFRPQMHSLSCAQVMPEPYTADQGRIIVREMAVQMALELLSERLTAGSVAVGIHYDREAVDSGRWKGPVQADYYGRMAPKPARGTAPLEEGGARIHTDSARLIEAAAVALYDRLAEPSLTIRRFELGLGDVRAREAVREERQTDLFTPPETLLREEEARRRERRLGEAMLDLRRRYGANAVIKGTSLEEGATGRQRNTVIGGHASGEEG